MNIGQMLVNTARRLPDRPAITWGASTRNYREVDRRTNALARGLASLGVQHGDRVGVLMRNRPELIEAMYACFKAGYCLVPLNARLTADEVAFHLHDAGAAAVVTDGEGQPVAAAGGAEVVVVAGPHGPLA